MKLDWVTQRAVAGLRLMADDLHEMAGTIEAERNGKFSDEATAMERSCLGKRAYPTAERAGQAATGRTTRGVDYLRVYHCTFCEQFHLTSRTLAAFHGLEIG